MALTIAALRALAGRPVLLHCSAGSFAGTIEPDYLSETSVMLEFVLDGDSGIPVLIALDDITEVVER